MTGLEEDVALLREAAALARDGEASEAPGREFLGALSDWWDGEAIALGETEAFVDLFTACVEQASGVEVGLHVVKTDDGRIAMHSSTTDAALRAARIFLRRPA